MSAACAINAPNIHLMSLTSRSGDRTPQIGLGLGQVWWRSRRDFGGEVGEIRLGGEVGEIFLPDHDLPRLPHLREQRLQLSGDGFRGHGVQPLFSSIP